MHNSFFHLCTVQNFTLMPLIFYKLMKINPSIVFTNTREAI